MEAGLAIPVIAGLGFFTALAFTGFMVHAGVGDEPDHRSAHKNLTPTAGGIGIIAGLAMSLFVLPALFPTLELPAALPTLLSLIFAVGMIGLLDDVLTLPTSVKMLLLLIVSGLAVWAVGPVTYLPNGRSALELPFIIGFSGSLLWLFTVTNVVNFMDGSNGILGISLGLASFALIGVGFIANAPVSALLALLLTASILGFLPYNMRKQAQIFAGDVGALTVGFSYAAIVLLMVREAQNMSVVYAGPLLILPFLADSLLTMLRRAIRGEKIWQPHNMHLYQRYLQARRSHLNVAWSYGFVSLLLCNLVLFGGAEGWLLSPWTLIVPSLILTGLYGVLSKRLPD